MIAFLGSTPTMIEEIIKSGGICYGWIKWVVNNYPYHRPDVVQCTTKKDIAPLTIAIGILYIWTKRGGQKFNMIALLPYEPFASFLHDILISLASSVKAPDNTMCSISALTNTSIEKGNYQYHCNLSIAYIPEWIKWIKKGNLQFDPQTMVQRCGASRFNWIFVIEAENIINREQQMLTQLYDHWNITHFKGDIWAILGKKQFNSQKEIDSLGVKVRAAILDKFVVKHQ